MPLVSFFFGFGLTSVGTGYLGKSDGLAVFDLEGGLLRLENILEMYY
jgi:hypothetical protein